MMTASVAWAIDAMAARKSYAAEFYASLKKGYLDLSSPLVDFTPDQVRYSQASACNLPWICRLTASNA
jgi:hypothetical protein